MHSTCSGQMVCRAVDTVVGEVVDDETAQGSGHYKRTSSLEESSLTRKKDAEIANQGLTSFIVEIGTS